MTFWWLLGSRFWLLKGFLVFLVLYLHAFLELDHEWELGEDGQMSFFGHGQLWRLQPHCREPEKRTQQLY